MKKFLFVLGRSVDLATFELESILEKRFLFSDFTLTKNRATIKSNSDPEAIAGLIGILGGTIKIAELAGEGDPINVIRQDLLADPVRDVGFSSYQSILPTKELFNLKGELKERNIKLRLVLPKEGSFLNAAEIKTNRLTSKGREYLIIGQEAYRTLSHQDVDRQAERDYEKPSNDARSGMVPPKLARMMVNIAACATRIKSQKPKSKNSRPLDQLETRNCNDLVIVDPFCGSGNILIEAIDLGFSVQGSDISDQAVKSTQINIDWAKKELIGKNQSKVAASVFKADATKDNFLNKVENLAVVVAEPYLGQPYKRKLSNVEVEQEFSKIAGIYLNFLANCKQYATGKLSDLSLCLIFPKFEVESGKSRSLYEDIVDRIHRIGYITLAGPFDYGRDYQVVKREILLLKLT